jgi:Predicted amino acid aldolase or racemase
MSQQTEWYKIDGIEGLDSPSLVIYIDRVKRNIKTAIDIIGDIDRLRPHIKTHKSKDIALLLKKSGIKKFKCATIAEADILGMIQAEDVLLAYQPTGPKIDRFLSIIKDYTHTKFSCLIDNKIVADEISRKATQNYIQLNAFIDINVGMDRSGIKPEATIELIEYIRQLKGLQVIGLHVYDGHINMSDLNKRTELINAAFEPIEKLRKELQKRGFNKLTVVAGGSPSFTIHAKNKQVEASPGTFIYWDAGYLVKLKEQPFVPASLVVSRIISNPNENIYTCDLGHKSVSAENSIGQRVVFLNAPDLVPIAQSEEHLVLKSDNGTIYRPGDVLYGLPYHICPTVALYEKASIVEQHRLIDEWEIAARNRRLEH